MNKQIEAQNLVAQEAEANEQELMEEFGVLANAEYTYMVSM